MAKKRLKWHDSDAPDAKGKFKELSAQKLAEWVFKTRKGNAQKINGAFVQQRNFNKDRPTYAAKMERARKIAMKMVDKKKGESMAMYVKSNSPLSAVRKTKAGANLKRWFKEEWKDEKGNVCGSEENKNTKVCRPSRRISKDSPKPWNEMSKREKRKVTRAKKRVGMGRRRASSSNVS
jgi:hypothetical protein